MKKRLITAAVLLAMIATLFAVPANCAPQSKILVVYFSATGTTEGAAKSIQSVLGADICEIVPAEPYTSDDLNYNSDCRANREQNDSSSRPEISGSIDGIDKYDVIFVGYPIWWGKLPKIMYTFFDTYDLSGKVIVPFCTSGSTGISASENEIRALEPNANVRSGRRLNGATENSIKEWTEGLALPSAEEVKPEITVDGQTVSVNDVPENATLILAFYQNGKTVNALVKKVKNGDEIDLSPYSDDADLMKAFLWDMTSIRPLCESKIIKSGEKMIYIYANDHMFEAKLENNSSADAFYELLKQGDVTVSMHDYGSFEKVGSLPVSLPRNDTQITTEPGDVILYQGDQITIYYDKNSWNFTKLGKIANVTKQQLLDAFGVGNVEIRFSINK